MEKLKCEHLLSLNSGGYEKMFEQSRRVYGIDGLAPTQHCVGGGNLETKIAEPIGYDQQNATIRQDGTVGTLTTDDSSPNHNNRVIEPIIYDDYNSQIKADQSADGTLTTNCGNDAPRNGTKIILPDGAVTLETEPTEFDVIEVNGKAYIYIQGDWCRIRKLTPKECWRLMDFDDADFEKAEKVNSNAQLYKQAGNSIVVSVLEVIIGEMV